eukprot:SM000151S01524  [mRNA]  locus=s151:329315:329997:- [translate_table: standard]
MFVLPDADHPDFLLHFVDEGYTQEQALEVPPDSGHSGTFPDAVAALTKQQWANVSAAYKSVITFVATHPAAVAVALLAQAAVAVYYFMVWGKSKRRPGRRPAHRSTRPGGNSIRAKRA